MSTLRLVRTILFSTCIFSAGLVSADEYDQGMAAYTAGRYDEALTLWTGLAADGHSRAQFNLAYMFEFGISVPSDLPTAVHWYRQAAEQGYARAQNFLGWMYEMGKGVEHNRDEALKWLRLAADQGSEDAQADYRLVSNRKKRQDEVQFKQDLLDALKVEMERAGDRYEEQPRTPPAEKDLEASNHTI